MADVINSSKMCSRHQNKCFYIHIYNSAHSFYIHAHSFIKGSRWSFEGLKCLASIPVLNAGLTCCPPLPEVSVYFPSQLTSFTKLCSHRSDTSCPALKIMTPTSSPGWYAGVGVPGGHLLGKPVTY